MVKRTLVISDIHGCLNQFNALLNLVNYQPNRDQLILLGDYVDRGPKGKDVVQKVLDLSKNDKVITLRGNHDHRFLKLVESRDPEILERFLRYGGLETLKSYCPNVEKIQINDVLDIIQKEHNHHLEFFSKLPFYYESDQFIFVHAGLNPTIQNWKEQPADDFLSIRSSFINNKTVVDKIVIFGHSITYDIHDSDDIWFSPDKIGIDGGCAYGHQLNCLEILNDHSFNQYHIR